MHCLLSASTLLEVICAVFLHDDSRTAMPDLLSKFLETLSPRSYVATGMRASSGLAIRYDAFAGLKLICVDHGACFVSPSADADERIELREGDAIALVAPQNYIIATSADAPPRESRDVKFRLSDGLALYGDSGCASVRLFAGKMVPDKAVAQFFFSALPSVLVIRRDEGGDSIRRMMRIIHYERLGREPGAEYATSRLIDLVMLTVIRFALQFPDAGRAGLFLAMKDRRLVPALWLIHNEPARDWTVDMLAEAAHMSRPRFSAHFRSIIGMPPMDYLVRWRIRLAVQRLRDTDDPVKVIAASLSFKTPVAFARTFRRQEGITPRKSRAESRKLLQATLESTLREADGEAPFAEKETMTKADV